ncbi:MAG: hypothetical protein KZQ84_13020 [Candidatus Thiodiazotropha sp. (ex Lucinoma borealis)]|nr:hypothetical protein [Candidatus Thiodiazotropha sp. (ex Lucinoma borealis)]
MNKPQQISLGLLFVIYTLSLLAETNLYRDSVNIKASDGKDLIMTFEEIERYEKYSIIKVKHISGASVALIMFVVKGDYKIAKIRGAKYFINLKEWKDNDGSWMYKIGYSSTDNIDPITYFGKDIDTSKELKFMSVKDYDMLWDVK